VAKVFDFFEIIAIRDGSLYLLRELSSIARIEHQIVKTEYVGNPWHPASETGFIMA
jgi:hypothetical protein